MGEGAARPVDVRPDGGDELSIDPDAMFRPDYEGPPPVESTPASFTTPPAMDHHGGTPVEPDAPASLSRRRVLIGLGVAGVAGAGSLALLGGGDVVDGTIRRRVDPNETGDVDEVFTPAPPNELDLVAFEPPDEPFVGADPRRLPGLVTEAWRVPLAFPSPADSRVGVIGSRAVVAISSPPGEPVGPAAIAAFEAATGRFLWSGSLEGPASVHRFVGAVGDAVIVWTPSRGHEVRARVSTTGEPLWQRSFGDSSASGVAAVEPLAGTPLLAVRPVDETEATTLVDPETGDDVGSLDGVVVGTDHTGTWFVVRDGVVRSHDLTDGWQPGVDVGPAVSSDPAARTVVTGGRVVTALDSPTQAPDGFRSRMVVAEDDVPARSVDIGLLELDEARITVLTALAGSGLLVLAAGRTVAARLDGARLVPAWRSDGFVTGTVETVRGTYLLVSRAGGRRNEIVDAATGDTVEALTMAPGVFDALVLAGNGFLTRKVSRSGTRTVALDLDGNEMWSLPAAPSPLVVGDGVVARVEVDGDRLMLVAYSDPGAR